MVGVQRERKRLDAYMADVVDILGAQLCQAVEHKFGAPEVEGYILSQDGFGFVVNLTTCPQQTRMM